MPVLAERSPAARKDCSDGGRIRNSNKDVSDFDPDFHVMKTGPAQIIELALVKWPVESTKDAD